MPGHCALMGATRPASVIVQLLFSVFCVSFLFIFPTRDASPPLEVAFCGCVLWLRYLYYTTNTLLAEYLTSYTNSLQLIDCQCFTQCKMLQIPPTRNLHNSRCCHTDKHGRKMSRHRGAERSVAPTNCSASLCRIIYCIRPNRLRDRG